LTVKLASLKANLTAETQGEWEDSTIPSLAAEGVAYLVRSLNEPSYHAARAALLQRFARKHGKNPVPADELSTEFGRLYAKHILLGWRGLDVEFSPSVAAETLGDPAYREIVADIEACAAQVGRAKIEFVEDAAKNSEPPSATS
jgi:hypothetical protein